MPRGRGDVQTAIEAIDFARRGIGPPFKRNPAAQLATVDRIQANLSFQMWVHAPNEVSCHEALLVPFLSPRHSVGTCA